MIKTKSLLTALALTAFVAPAFADDTVSATSKTKVEMDSDGNYDRKTTSEQTDVLGTTTESKVKVKVKHDRHGNVTKSVDSKNVVDPKGLLNKTTTKSSTSEEHNVDGSTEYHNKKKINGKTVVDENIETGQ